MANKFDFIPEEDFEEDIEFKEEKPFRPLGLAAKGLAKGAAVYGDILNFINRIGSSSGQKYIDKLEKTNPEVAARLQEAQDLREKKQILGVGPQAGSEEVGKGLEKLGFPTQAETPTERFVERSGEFLGSLLATGGVIPGGSAAQTAIKTGASVLVPAAVATATEEADLPPWMQATATIASSLLSHRLTGKSLRDLNSEKYAAIEKMIPEDAVVSASQLKKSLRNMETNLKRGGAAPSEKATLDFIKKINNKIQGGKIEVKDAMGLRRSANEIILQDEIRKAPPRAKSLLKSLSKSLSNTIERYSSQNPEAVSLWKEANSAHRGLSQSRLIEKFFKDHPILAAEGGLILHLIKPLSLGSGTFGGIAAVKAGETVTALARNPGLRKLYFQVMKSAAKNDVRATLTSLKKFNEKAAPEFEEELDFIED